MDRLKASNSVPFASRDVAPSGTPQYATIGNPASSIPATLLPAYFINMLQDELLAVVTAAGLTADDSNWAQLLAAIRGTSSTGSSGWRKNLLTGEIIQWGVATLPNSGTQTSSVSVTYPLAFPTARDSIILTPAQNFNTAGGMPILAAISSTLTGFTLSADNNLGGSGFGNDTFNQTVACFWRAWGR